MKNFSMWLMWLVMTAMVVAVFAYRLTAAEDKSMFIPGELTDGHHQIGMVCETCHGDSFSDRHAMQEACVQCHGEQRKKPFDSHPQSKFMDPRNADRLANIDALYCVTCHVEHKPDLLQKTGLTQPVDFCMHCHTDIGRDRPSHESMAFDTCASAGCHNFHNNRALYTDFLIRHMHEPDVLDKAQVPQREFARVLDEIVTYPHASHPVKKLILKDMDAPANIAAADKVKQDWLTTAHASAGVNCSACHLTESDKSPEVAEWVDKPNHSACVQCHDVEVKHFMQGKHGMRLRLNLPPMTAALARLPMKGNVPDQELGCNSCHGAHAYNLADAAVESCLGCHDDRHSRAYKSSPHYQLWKKEQAGDLPEGSGVSCATCHMPRESVDVSDWLRRTVVQHNQNATLAPNEKMIRPVCLHCHGLGFSLDALADLKLVQRNFSGQPSIHVESIDMAERENRRHLQETGNDMVE